MATEQRSQTRHGWARCPGCGGQFLREHRCRQPLGVVVDRRPAGFEAAVEEARAQARAEAAAAAVVQLELPTVVDASCRTCGAVDVALGDDGDCVPCMTATALAAADASSAGAADGEDPSRAPP
jgi:predicted RNA-binding Zn-ribbon protein involved in translation (DUF1610 family)